MKNKQSWKWIAPNSDWLKRPTCTSHQKAQKWPFACAYSLLENSTVLSSVQHTWCQKLGSWLDTSVSVSRCPVHFGVNHSHSRFSCPLIAVWYMSWCVNPHFPNVSSGMWDGICPQTLIFSTVVYVMNVGIRAIICVWCLGCLNIEK